MSLAALILLAQLAVPAPRGYVNDFAGVLDSVAIRRLDAVINEVRAKTQGEIVVVTLGDIGQRAASDVAVQIGRQWGVGPGAPAGDPTKNLGVIVLLVPLQNGRPGTGQVFIATGRGAEGFLPDARVGRIRDAMIPYLADEDYAAGLAVGVGLLAQAFAAEFRVSLDSAGRFAPRAPAAPGPRTSPFSIIILAVFLIIFSLARRGRRRRAGMLPYILGGMIGGRGWGAGRGGWGGGGFGGGGFGGFGGGGGFSGGGAGGRF